MVILGLDLGTTTGWALRTTSPGYHSRLGDVDWQSGTWILREAGDYVGDRMALFKTRLLEELGEVDAVAYEDVSFAVGTGGKIIGYQTGIVLAECAWREILCGNVAVPTLKKHATGHGRAKKPDMIMAAWKLGADPQDDNEADAILVAEWMAQNIREEATYG